MARSARKAPRQRDENQEERQYLDSLTRKDPEVADDGERNDETDKKDHRECYIGSVAHHLRDRDQPPCARNRQP